MLTTPKALLAQSGLVQGNQVELRSLGTKMALGAPTRPSYKLADLVTEMLLGLSGADAEHLGGAREDLLQALLAEHRCYVVLLGHVRLGVVPLVTMTLYGKCTQLGQTFRLAFRAKTRCC